MHMTEADLQEATEEELRALLNRAYTVFPRKGEFFSKLGALPGVIMSNQSHEFCRGFLACLKTKEESAAFIIRHVGTNEKFSRSFLIENPDAFEEECSRVANKANKVVPTPEKVMVKMVLLRLHRLRKEIDIYNNWAKRFGPSSGSTQVQFQFPVIRQKSDLNKFRDSTSGIQVYTIKGVNKITLEMSSHVEFTDAVYNEAWNLFEVQGVMES